MWGFKGNKQSLDMKKMLPLVLKLGNFLKEAFDHYIQCRTLDNSLPVEALSLFIEKKMESWNPTLHGKEVLDVETKKSAARFVAGLAINMAQEQK
jgi:hypothetical protein